MRSVVLVLAVLTVLQAFIPVMAWHEPRAMSNSPPSVGNIRLPYTVDVNEDVGLFWIEPEPLFTDPDEGDTLTYLIKNEDGVWSSTYDDGMLAATIVNNGSRPPDYSLKMMVEPDISGEFVIRINATDDDETAPLSAELDIHIIVSATNDPPVLDRVGSYMIDPGMTRIDLDTEQGKKVNVLPYAHDVDGDPLVFFWDIASVLKKAVHNVTFDFDPATGQLWFRTTDADVPQFLTKLTVSDPGGLTDSVEVRVYVENLNDQPFISVPARKATVEGESIYITPSGGDPDLDSGDILTYSYNIGMLTAVVPPTALHFDSNTGRLTIDAVDERMNGEWEVNITVTDTSMASAWGICRLIIENQNDPPIASQLNKNVLEKNLTVTFITASAKDEDGDKLLYYWDFGDGSPIQSGIDLRTVKHTYGKAGTYTASMYVSDGIAESETKTVTVTVQAPDPIPDADRDGMLDSWERRAGLDPMNPLDATQDPDGDGLTNLEEFQYNQTNAGAFLNPNNPDTDGDGSSDRDEVRAGANPVDANDKPDPKFEDIAMILTILGWILIGFSVILFVLFLVVKIRNRRARSYMAPPPTMMQYNTYQQPQYTYTSPFQTYSPPPQTYTPPVQPTQPAPPQYVQPPEVAYPAAVGQQPEAATEQAPVPEQSFFTSPDIGIEPPVEQAPAETPPIPEMQPPPPPPPEAH